MVWSGPFYARLLEYGSENQFRGVAGKGPRECAMQEAFWPPAGSSSRVVEWLVASDLSSRRQEIPGSKIIYQPGDRAADVYYLESGQVRVFQVNPDGPERLADILGPGSWFGIAALARRSTYETRAEVVSDSVIWAVESDRILQRFSEESFIAADLIMQLAMRLRAAHGVAARLMFEDTSQRLLRTLIEFSKTSAAVPYEEGVLLHMTHQQLAQAVGAARETVSVALTQLRQQNLLRTGRNRLMFNPAALRQFSEQLKGEEQTDDTTTPRSAEPVHAKKEPLK
jgi:CRP-like cAMP-binding protein